MTRRAQLDKRVTRAVIRPIENSPTCSNAACHVHPAGQQVLGVIDADLSLATVDAQMAQQQATLTWFLVGAIVFGCGAAVAVHVGGGLPAGEGADRRHPPGGRTATWITACRSAPTTNWATWRSPSTR